MSFDAAAAPPAPPPVIAGHRIDWSARDVGFGALWFLFLFLLMPLPATVPFLAFGSESKPFYAASLIVTLFSQAGLIVVAAFFTFRKYGGSWDRLGFRVPTLATFGWGLAGFAAVIAVGIAYGLVIQAFDLDSLKSQCDDQLPSRILNDPLLLAIAGVAVVGFAPVCEEVFFRGFSFTGLGRSWGVPVAAVASALFWSSAHVSPSLHKTIVPIFLIGIVLAATYVKSGNILSTILAHAAYNIIGFIAIAGCDR